MNFNDFTQKIKQLEIKILLLTSPGYVDVLSSRIFNELSDYPLKIKTIPSVTSLISGLFEIAELRDYLECLRWSKEERKLLDDISEGIRSELEGEKK